MSIKNIHLFLFFTRGISLKIWDEAGLLEREVALYKALHQQLGGIAFITYGDSRDLRYGDRLNGIRVICNRWKLPKLLYCWLLANFYPFYWKENIIVKSNQVQGADIALKVARRAGKKFIARCGYLYSDFMERRYGDNSFQTQQARSLERKVFTSADRVVVTTPLIRQMILDRYHVLPKRIEVIPNYVDTGLFSPAERSCGTVKRIGFVGRLDEQKNLSALFEAVKDIDTELIIVGNGHLRQTLKEKAHKNGLTVHFLGNVPHRQLPEILNKVDLFILPSHYEGHPKALLEAMACGLPVIGTDVPGIRELISHKETGYLCGTSPEEIREAIKEVMANRELRERMSHNAREFVVENFSFERILKLELELLQELAEE